MIEVKIDWINWFNNWILFTPRKKFKEENEYEWIKTGFRQGFINLD